MWLFPSTRPFRTLHGSAEQGLQRYHSFSRGHDRDKLKMYAVPPAGRPLLKRHEILAVDNVE
jgi:hypothetical protein